MGSLLDMIAKAILICARRNVSYRFQDWTSIFLCIVPPQYLNSGAGGAGAAFIHDRHLQKLPAVHGWWGNDPSTKFLMKRSEIRRSSLHMGLSLIFIRPSLGITVIRSHVLIPNAKYLMQTSSRSRTLLTCISSRTRLLCSSHP